MIKVPHALISGHVVLHFHLLSLPLEQLRLFWDRNVQVSDSLGQWECAKPCPL